MDLDLAELAELATDLGAVLSHGTAALIHAQRGMRLTTPPGRPCVTVDKNRSRIHRAGVDIRRRDLTQGERCLREGIPVTRPLRTVVDLARDLPFGEAVASADSVLNRRMVSERQLREEITRARGPGATDIRRALLAADGRSQSVPETELRLALLEVPGIGRVVPQWRLIDDGHPYDIGLPDLRKVLEYQSWQWHNNRGVWRRDARWGNEACARSWGYLQVVHEDLCRGTEHLAGLVFG